MKSKINKIIAILLSLLIVTTIFSTTMILNTEQAEAQEQLGCCLETKPIAETPKVSKQCVTTTRDNCIGRFYTGPPYDCSNVPDCKPGTCIPKDKSEPCLRNKPLAECSAQGGVPDPRPLEEIPQCKPGCCIIAKGVKAEVKQYRQCENLTLTLGYDLNMMEFKEGIISEIECKKQGSPSDLGCCVLGGGECKYGPRQECQEGNFVPLQGGLFCRDVAACALTNHSYYDCGKLPGTETDIYWFDSQGNQEELKEACNYPNKICQKSELGIVYCKDTTCKIKGQAQNMTGTPPKVEKIDIDTTLVTGTSLCYNFYTHYGDDRMLERSTGLQNQIIHCSFGKYEIEGLGTDREKLCVQGGETPALIHGTVVENRWENCSECGKSPAVLNLIGDFFIPTVGIPGGSVLGAVGEYCTKDKCESGDYGDCVWHGDYLGSTNVPFLGPVAVGSCDPKYPPGQASSKCAECGGGGDSLWNLCTRAECYSKGDCEFHKAGLGRMAWTSPLIFAGLSWAERTPLIILDCAVTMIYCAANCSPPPCKNPACEEPRNRNFFNCIGDRFGTYTLGTSVGVLKWLVIDMVWGQFVKGAIGPMIQSAAGGFGGAPS
ncbi:MAG: hypothetical protein QXK80_02070 [Candidatus Pacearchaeota archaeon]